MMAALLRSWSVEMAVEAIDAGVDFAADEPLGERRFPDTDFLPRLRAQVSSAAAILPQNLSGFFSEALCILAYFFIEPIRAFLANFADGLKTRFSFNIESMLTT